MTPEHAKIDHRRFAEGTIVKGKLRGKGDVVSAYSADLIDKGKTRKPFAWRNASWIVTATESSGKTGYERCDVYRIVDIERFSGTPTTYAEKVYCDNGETARSDPNGFYHGMQVNGTKVLVGPEIVVEPGPPTGQLDLL